METQSVGIIKEIENEQGATLAICEYSENDRYYIDALQIPSKDVAVLETMNSRRRQEILTSRFLLQHLTGKSIWSSFLKDAYGKPYLKDSNSYISLSHSHKRSAAILSDKRVGIDLQKHVLKINRIKNKYLNPNELQSINKIDEVFVLHLYWGAKESMYKSYGKKEVNFKEHLFVDYIEKVQDSGKFSSKMIKDDFKASYTMYYEKLDDFYLVYGIPDDEPVL